MSPQRQRPLLFTQSIQLALRSPSSLTVELFVSDVERDGDGADCCNEPSVECDGCTETADVFGRVLFLAVGIDVSIRIEWERWERTH